MHALKRDRENPRQPDSEIRTLDIGGRKLALRSSGAGLPTVVLETGLGAESDDWRSVQSAIEKHTCVLRYDRAGRGASDRAARPRCANDMIDDLESLLHVAQLPGPYVLVGHSFGGLLVRLFAHRHPRDVLGLILVDAMHEDQFEVFGPTFPPATPTEPAALRSLREFWTTGWRNPESTAEGIDFVSSIAQARAARDFGDLPIHVLTAGTFTNQLLVPPRLRDSLQRRWEDLQEDFLAFSSSARRSFVRDSGHFIQRDNPEAVVQAVEAMIESTRANAAAMPR